MSQAVRHVIFFVLGFGNFAELQELLQRFGKALDRNACILIGENVILLAIELGSRFLRAQQLCAMRQDDDNAMTSFGFLRDIDHCNFLVSGLVWCKRERSAWELYRSEPVPVTLNAERNSRASVRRAG